MNKTRLLILCTGNSCRSQMAEGFFRAMRNDEFEVYSAGIEAHGLNPRAVKVMKESGIDISNQTSDTVDKYLNISFDRVITVCDNVRESCPIFPSATNKIHKSFPDPVQYNGTEEEIMNEFRRVRDEIREFVESIL
ncbi:MAG: arsenate reductase (thioredoxin) [Flavobacteriales bacterium]